MVIRFPQVTDIAAGIIPEKDAGLDAGVLQENPGDIWVNSTTAEKLRLLQLYTTQLPGYLPNLFSNLIRSLKPATGRKGKLI